MKNLEISPRFTIEDIHKIREYDYEMTKDMTLEEEIEYYRKGGEDARRGIAYCREQYLKAKVAQA